jgi:hypothetical protein
MTYKTSLIFATKKITVDILGISLFSVFRAPPASSLRSFLNGSFLKPCACVFVFQQAVTNYDMWAKAE